VGRAGAPCSPSTRLAPAIVTLPKVQAPEQVAVAVALLETHCALALVDENRQASSRAARSTRPETQEIVAHVLALDSARVTVQCLRMGGGFGGKQMQLHGLAAVAALGAVHTGRPVQLRLNRTQDMRMTGQRHPFWARWRVGFDSQGRLQAFDATLTSDGG
jgi:xanthine dehydrogenase large subunit